MIFVNQITNIVSEYALNARKIDSYLMAAKREQEREEMYRNLAQKAIESARGMVAKSDELLKRQEELIQKLTSMTEVKEWYFRN